MDKELQDFVTAFCVKSFSRVELSEYMHLYALTGNRYSAAVDLVGCWWEH